MSKANPFNNDDKDVVVPTPWCINIREPDNKVLDEAVTTAPPPAESKALPLNGKEQNLPSTVPIGLVQEVLAPTQPLVHNESSYGWNFKDYIYGQPKVTFELLEQAGISFAQAQSINAQMLRGQVAANNLHAINREKFSYMMALAEFKNRDSAVQNMIANESGQVLSIASKATGTDFNKLEQNFISTLSLVKVRPRYSTDWVFMRRSPYYHRHVAVNEQDLTADFMDFLDDALPADDESSQAVRLRSFQRMKRTIPRLQDSSLYILLEEEVMFIDGVYNVRTREFKPCTSKNQNKCFNIFSIEIEYGDGQADTPEVFDAFLSMILDNNQDAHYGVYQMIGSILTPMSSLKKCYLLQGKSGSGKTTLVNYIMRLMPLEDNLEMNDLSGITDAGLPKKTFRFLHVKELGTNKIPAKQLVSIKALADGSPGDMPGTASFKILFTTNNRVTTGDGYVIEPALKARLLVIPFPKAIDLSDVDERITALDDVYFEQERRAIILKSLRAYSEVLDNKGQFCCDFDVNAVVDTPTENTASLNPEEREVLYNGIGQPMIPYNALNEIFRTAFIITEKVNPAMTTTIVMNSVNRVREGLLQNEASTGRKLTEFFGIALKSARISGNTCYNLEFNIPSDTPESLT